MRRMLLGTVLVTLLGIQCRSLRPSSQEIREPRIEAHVKQNGVDGGATAEPEYYALLINGGGDPNHVRSGDAPDMALAYNALRSRNGGERWKKQNIFALQSNGNSADQDSYDLMTGATTTQNRDFDGDGRSEVTGPASEEAVNETFAKLQAIVKPNDELFIFVVDHGSPSHRNQYDASVEAGIVLWNDEILTVSELRQMIEALAKCASLEIVDSRAQRKFLCLLHAASGHEKFGRKVTPRRYTRALT